MGRFKELKAKTWQDWFTNEENIKKFQDALPEGVKYLGAHLVVIRSADHDFEQWFEIDNWAVLDNWRKQAEDPNSKYAKFIQAMINETGVLIEQVRSKFLRPAGQVAIFQPSKS